MKRAQALGTPTASELVHLHAGMARHQEEREARKKARSEGRAEGRDARDGREAGGQAPARTALQTAR